jgi:hypothetical protein
MPCVMKKQKVVKGLAHIVNQGIGGKPLRKADNVISAGNFFNITFICCYSIVLMCYNVLQLKAGVNQPNTFERFRSLDFRCC